MFWDYFVLLSLAVMSVALYFNLVTIMGRIQRGEDVLKLTFAGGFFLAYIVLTFFIKIQSIFNHI